jgi:hypothetical protein
MFDRMRASFATVIAAAIVLGASPVRAVDRPGISGFSGPIPAWLARAPASCVMDSYFTEGRNFPNPNHVAYWVGHAMDGDMKDLESHLPWPTTWQDSVSGGTEVARAVYDPHLHVAAFNIGHQDMNEWGFLADEPAPPAGATRTRADLSRLALGGNVHLGDSLATVTSALGLHTLAPTNAAPACPGFAVVELCDWNVARCACPPSIFYQGSHDISGTIIFRNRRVVGLFWNRKCWAAG